MSLIRSEQGIWNKKSDAITSLFLFIASGTRIQNHLCASEQRERFAVGFISDGCIPDLSSTATMHKRGNASNSAFTDCAEEVALEFDGGEIVGALRQRGEGAVAAGSIGESDHGGSV